MAGSNYPSGFAQGVTIRGTPIDIPNPGEVFWVNNSSVLAKDGVGGSNGNDGSYRRPFSTLDYAVGKTTASRGDVIYVMPGHVETFTAADGVDFDVAGITVIGLGRGTKQPQFKLNHANAELVIGANDVGLYNLRITSTITGVKIGIDVETLNTDSVISGCRFDVETTTTDEFLITINYTVGCDNFLVENCTIDNGLGGAAAGIKLVGATAGGTIRNNRIVGDYSLAIISGITTASTEIYIEDNTLFQGGSGDINAVAAIVLVNATTGLTARNVMVVDLTTHVAAQTGSGRIMSLNQHTDEAGTAVTTSNTSASILISADA